MTHEEKINQLACACMGIGRTVECKHLPTDADMNTTLLRSLYMVFYDQDFHDDAIDEQIQKMKALKKRLIPSCSLCGSPCGVNDDPDLRAIQTGPNAQARLQLLDRCISIGASLGGTLNLEIPEANDPLFTANSQIISFLYESLYLACTMQNAQELV